MPISYASFCPFERLLNLFIYCLHANTAQKLTIEFPDFNVTRTVDLKSESVVKAKSSHHFIFMGTANEKEVTPALRRRFVNTKRTSGKVTFDYGQGSSKVITFDVYNVLRKKVRILNSYTDPDGNVLKPALNTVGDEKSFYHEAMATLYKYDDFKQNYTGETVESEFSSAYAYVVYRVSDDGMHLDILGPRCEEVAIRVGSVALPFKARPQDVDLYVGESDLEVIGVNANPVEESGDEPSVHTNSGEATFAHALYAAFTLDEAAGNHFCPVDLYQKPLFDKTPVEADYYLKLLATAMYLELNSGSSLYAAPSLGKIELIDGKLVVPMCMSSGKLVPLYETEFNRYFRDYVASDRDVAYILSWLCSDSATGGLYLKIPELLHKAHYASYANDEGIKYAYDSAIENSQQFKDLIASIRSKGIRRDSPIKSVNSFICSEELPTQACYAMAFSKYLAGLLDGALFTQMSILIEGVLDGGFAIAERTGVKASQYPVIVGNTERFFPSNGGATREFRTTYGYQTVSGAAYSKTDPSLIFGFGDEGFILCGLEATVNERDSDPDHWVVLHYRGTQRGGIYTLAYDPYPGYISSKFTEGANVTIPVTSQARDNFAMFRCLRDCRTSLVASKSGGSFYLA